MSRRTTADVTSYESAEKFLAGGRNKDRRRLASNRCVERLNAETVGIVLHNTVIVAFHADGSQTINTGGWNTVTTRQWINAHSRARVWTEGDLIVRIHEPSLTAPRVQKCRMCHGVGNLPQTCYGYRWDYQTNTRQNCEHGRSGPHPNGTRECFRCAGAGRTDYGSKPIHYEWSGGPLLLSDTGEPLPDADAQHYYGTSAHTATTASKPAPYVPSYSPGSDLVDGSTVVTELARLVPGIRTEATCPACSAAHRLVDMVPHLNDRHRWTREQIADWLESLDADISFITA